MIFIIVIAILFLDRLTKILITSNLVTGESIPVINNIFHITLVKNRGAAFGLLQGKVPFILLTSLLAVVLIYFNLKDSKGNRPVKIFLSLILAGALGNLFDRLMFGYVIDFLDFRVWPVFNVADSAITVGAILLGWSMITKKDSSCIPKSVK